MGDGGCCFGIRGAHKSVGAGHDHENATSLFVLQKKTVSQGLLVQRLITTMSKCLSLTGCVHELQHGVYRPKCIFAGLMHCELYHGSGM